MGKFKIGDKAWYFDAEWDGDITMYDIHLKSVILNSKEMVESYNQAPLYHSTKREALNTMSRRLKEFLDYDQTVDED